MAMRGMEQRAAYNQDAAKFALADYIEGKEREGVPVSSDIFLVTGASRGLGRAIATELALRGCNVAWGVRDEGVFKEATQGLSNFNYRFPADLRDKEQIRAGVTDIKALPQYKDGTSKRIHIVHAATDGIPGGDRRHIREGVPFLRLIGASKKAWGTLQEAESKEAIRDYLNQPKIMGPAIALNYTAFMDLLEIGMEEGVVDKDSVGVATSSVFSRMCEKYIVDNGLEGVNIEDIYKLVVPNVPAIYNVGIVKAFSVIKARELAIQGKFKLVDTVNRELGESFVAQVLDGALWDLIEAKNPEFKRPRKVPTDWAAVAIARFIARPPLDYVKDAVTVHVEPLKEKRVWSVTDVEPSELYNTSMNYPC